VLVLSGASAALATAAFASTTDGTPATGITFTTGRHDSSEQARQSPRGRGDADSDLDRLGRVE
jgi:hypothetical protein